MKSSLIRTRIFGILFLALTVCSLFFSGMTFVNAETTGRVPVTYTKDKSNAYKLSVDVEGPGELVYQDDVLKNEQRNYLLPIDESISFEIKADKAAKIKTIELNGENVISQMVDGTITVKGQQKQQRLSVEFVKISGSTGNIIDNIPKTGDMARLGVYMSLLIISLAVGSFLYLKKKMKSMKLCIESEENNDIQE